MALYGMSMYRTDHAPDPPQLVLGFGNLSQRAIQAGIAAIGDLLDPTAERLLGLGPGTLRP